MKKHSKKSRTGRTWKVMILDDDEVWAEPKLNEKVTNAQPQSDMLDAVIYSASCNAVLALIDHLYRREILKMFRRKLIKSAAMLAISLTTLVMDLSIFFGWWI